MAIPVYVVTGFLGAGKTTFLNTLLSKRDWRDVSTLVVQLESGEEAFCCRYQTCRSLAFSKKMLEQQPDEVVRQIEAGIQSGAELPEEIWIECNGVVLFSELQALLLCPPLRALCRIEKVIHIADAQQIEGLLGRTGAALPEQIASCDFAVVRGVRAKEDRRRVRRLLHSVNPGVEVLELEEYKQLYNRLIQQKERPVGFFVSVLIVLAALYIAARPLMRELELPLNVIVNVFLGMVLQALPFLIIGVLLSSAIQVFVPSRFFESRFPKSLGAGMLVAVLSGFFLPVCDCASIPIFRSLVKKGVPLPAAVTFMAATPVINPVVMLSTYYAFGGSLTVVGLRVGLGILCAVAIGLVFAFWPPAAGAVLSGGGLDRVMCSCGCYEDAESVASWPGRIALFLRHAQAEFFSVGKYLLVGIFVASVFQTMGTGLFTAAQSGAGLAVSMLVMMAMAFALSLCSSSDAVIARSLANQFPMGAMMGFLIFGPMMDLKNVMMLSSGFSKRFIGRLLLVTFAVCFGVVFLASMLGVV